MVWKFHDDKEITKKIGMTDFEYYSTYRRKSLTLRKENVTWQEHFNLQFQNQAMQQIWRPKSKF